MSHLKLLAVLLTLSAASWAAESHLELSGTLSAADSGHYRMLSFQVPEGTRRLSVRLDPAGKPKALFVSLGLYGPLAYRGMGRTEFSVSESEATSPFLPGPIEPGEWKILLAAAQVPAGARWDFKIGIDLDTRLDPPKGVVLRPGPAWFTGELHSHTGHSDGACLSQNGHAVPCPTFKLVEAAAARGLDFLAITDHNTSATFNEMGFMQPYYDRMLLVRGREMTTFGGHANVWGTAEPVEFRVGYEGRTANDFLDSAHAAGGIVSINHPHWPYDARCPGCGWAWKDQTDFARVDGIEVVNGYRQENSWFKAPPGNGVPFWEEQVARGYRITALGGGDDHEGGTGLPHSGPGRPSNVIYARELSERALLEAISAGHVYVRAEGPDGPIVQLEATRGAQTAIMGDDLNPEPGERVRFRVTVEKSQGAQAVVFYDGRALDDATWTIDADRWSKEFDRAIAGGRHWLRVEVRDQGGTPLAITNPVYLRFGKR